MDRRLPLTKISFVGVALFLAALAVFVGAGAACSSSGGALHPDGSAGSGGSGGAPDGSSDRGGGGGTVASNCPTNTGPIDPGAIIDDMTSASYTIPQNEGRTGSWWAGGDSESPSSNITPNGNVAAEPIPGGRCGSLYAEHVTGFGFTSWAVLSVSMGYGPTDGGDAILPFDAQAFGYLGVTFWARIGDTSTNQVRFAISDEYSRPEGGICDPSSNTGDTACYDLFGVDLPQLDTTWHQYKIPFLELAQRHFGLPRSHLDTSSIYTIEFDLYPNTIFDLWVDDISFY
jgi:hypothetical protein